MRKNVRYLFRRRVPYLGKIMQDEMCLCKAWARFLDMERIDHGEPRKDGSSESTADQLS